jgi:hypothetical protein
MATPSTSRALAILTPLPTIYLLGTAGSPDSVASDISLAIDRSGWSKHSIQVTNPSGETVQIFVSNDLVNWCQYGADIIASAFILMDGHFPYIYVGRGATTDPVTVTISSGDRDFE